MTRPPAVVRVAVVEAQETVQTRVSRDVDDHFYELPADLVDEYEAAEQRWEAAQAAIVEYIERRHLQPQDLEEDDDA